MFFNKYKNKNLAIFNTMCFSQFDSIEQNIDDIVQNLNEEIINKKFERILSDLRILKVQINMVAINKHTTEIREKRKEINNRLYKIYDRITEIGTKQRKEILNKLDMIDLRDKSNIEIKQILGCIEERLDLENIEMEDNINHISISQRDQQHCVKGKITNCSISNRQIMSYEECIYHAISKNTKEGKRWNKHRDAI